ncbi:MAG: hypothetical protein ACK4TG_06120 [Thermaurantiacus sp.]
MAEDKRTDTKSGKGEKTIRTSSGVEAPPAVVAAGGGGAVFGDDSGGGGLVPMDVATDVAGKLDAIAPTFGEILKSVGGGVADAQRALDRSVIDTVRRLADTKIDVVTDVVQRIDDDSGLPLVPDPATDLITQQLSVLNFVTPTVHEWKYVSLFMDMTVSGFSQKTGMSFTSRSFTSAQTGVGLFSGLLGFGGRASFETKTEVDTDLHRESEWASGQVQLDAQLGPRRTNAFPVPASVDVGPQIFVTQGRTRDVTSGAGPGAPLVERNVEVTVTILKANGEANVGRNPVIEAPGLLREAVAGGATNAQGKVVYRLRRFYSRPGPFATFPVTVRLGALVRRFSVDL